MSIRIVLLALILLITGNAVAQATIGFNDRGVKLAHLIHHQDAGLHYHHDDGSFHHDDPDAAIDHTHADSGLVPACLSESPVVSLLALIPPRPAKLAAPRCPYPAFDGPLRPPRILGQVAPATRLPV